MPAEFGRHLRLASQIERELAPLVQRAASEAGLGLCTVTGVSVSSDLRHAKIYISRLSGGGKEAVAALAPSVGRLRHHLARRLRLRSVPRLALMVDETAARVARLDALLKAETPAAGSTTASP